ncbi:MAG: helix-turn-helix domain-containing protein [Ilumatobacteraceae bacterium]
MAERVQVRDVGPTEGVKLLGIVRRGSGSVVRWRRAQIVLCSVQQMDEPAIARIAFTSEDRVREVIHHFNSDGFDSLAPKYAGGRPAGFTLPERQQIKKIALSRPQDRRLPFSTWSLRKLAEFLVAEGVVGDISHEGLRSVLREEGVSFQVIKTFKPSNDPDFKHKHRPAFLAFVKSLRSLHPVEIPIAIVLDNFGPHLSTKKDQRVGKWAESNNVERAYTPTYSSWLNRIEAQFQALRYFALDGTDHASHHEQASMILRYIIWRNRNAHDRRLRERVKRANVA